jgi:hypothetical protein
MYLSSYCVSAGSVPIPTLNANGSVCCQACSPQNRGPCSLCSIKQHGGWIHRCWTARLRWGSAGLYLPHGEFLSW